VAQHEREQAANFGLVRHQPRERSTEANRFSGQIDSPAIALVVNEVHDRQYGREAFGQQLGRRHAERNTHLFDPGLCARESALRDVLGAETADSPQRECHLCLARERRMAAREHELEPLIGDTGADHELLLLVL
jgi:hypothetical protein